MSPAQLTEAELPSTTGRIVGVVDPAIPLRTEDLTSLVHLVEQGAFDLVLGQLDAGPTTLDRGRNANWVRRLLSSAMLGFSIADSDVGCLVFDRETLAATGMDTATSNGRRRLPMMELIARARLKNLRIGEMPVRLRDGETRAPATRESPGWLAYLAALLRLRPKIGLSYLKKSPIYWSPRVYELAQNLVLGAEFRQMFADLAELIPEGASVTDLCCGSGRLYKEFLRPKSCSYVGMDFNSHFVLALRKQHIDARFVDLPEDAIVPADFVVMCSSFYHFRNAESELLSRLKAAARKAVLISEPVRSLTNDSSKLFGRLANRLTDPGVGEFAFRHDLDSLRAFAAAHGATNFLYEPGKLAGIAIFAGLAS